MLYGLVYCQISGHEIRSVNFLTEGDNVPSFIQGGGHLKWALKSI